MPLLLILLTYLPPSQDVRREHFDVEVEERERWGKELRRELRK